MKNNYPPVQMYKEMRIVPLGTVFLCVSLLRSPPATTPSSSPLSWSPPSSTVPGQWFRSMGGLRRRRGSLRAAGQPL